MNPLIAFTGYAMAAIAYGILTGFLLTAWRRRVRGSLLLPASIASLAWAVALAYTSTIETMPAVHVLLLEVSFDLVWLFFLSSLLGGAVAVQSNWLVRHGGVALAAALLLTGALVELIGWEDRLLPVTGSLLVLGSIATSLFGLVGIEQLYRNARPAQQNGLKFLCLGLAGVFAYDLVLYSNAVIDGQINAQLWGARGYVIALCVPMIFVAIRRIGSWARGIFASRQVVFYTTTLFAAGIYLTLIGFAGYYIKTLGRDWGDALQLVFLSAAVLGFAVLALSDQVRARVAVWVVKHFFERKYDYRAEWLRLIQTLTSSEDGMPLKKRAVMSLGQMLNAPAGQLWLKGAGEKTLTLAASWNRQAEGGSLELDAPLAEFLAAKGWVVDVAELQAKPQKYAPVTSSDVTSLDSTAAFIVPLMHNDELIGLIALDKPRTPVTLNFEDHDLLKTAGRQIASYLAQEQATEGLAQSRQFEAYNRFTAFVMHDLKNAIAQQSLVVENAERHKHNPEFIDDAMKTIRGSVERMRRVLAHLRQGAMEQPAENLDLSALVLKVESQCADRQPAPQVTVPDHAVKIRANREGLTSALVHAIRNAQDACEGHGSVTVELASNGVECVVTISDTGCGMDEAFVRDRLFRPFDSTKGAEGMGIGAYQIRETLRASGGDVEVQSAVGKGTSMKMRLPVVGAVA